MPQLVWEPVDLLSLLGVAPAVGEHEASHQYVIEQGPVRLQITIRQYDADVEILLWAVPLPEPVLKYSLLSCAGIRVVTDRGRFLEFAATTTFTGRYDGYSVIPHGLRLWVEPQITLEPFCWRA
ncbi:hypothetical protein XpiCFBP4643_22855 [Xanthomonas pisi]|uniref:Uncharacterized protein n=1 Tax=Xanthomonas pisi TaxID=56457 RepID=A0A2S7CQL9_9XANT|nr:hypothetical protein XpiCFBP4643_22855 [Xanthomonas pisi]